MRNALFGRGKEIEILQKALNSNEAEMVSVIGRRRIGKTFLVKTVYANNIAFELTGIQHAPRSEQLRNFSVQLTKMSKSKVPIPSPKDWLEAFFLLSEFLESKLGDQKIAVFLDELPWMSTHKSGFLRGLSWFWNSWAVNKNVVVVICGSAASWMIQKVVNHRGGLHNRVTKRIQLYPFTLAETEKFLQSKNAGLDRYQLVQLYMVLGGIPHYLKEVEPGLSAVQNINNICFSQTGLLRNEFSRLYASLFDNAENHVAVIKTLAQYRQGLTRNQIVAPLKISEGATVTKVLDELTESGFISSFRPFGKKKKERLYRLTDEYSLFYLQFMEGRDLEGDDVWNHLSRTQSYKIWSGYAFENVCLKHISQIKKAMSIAGIYSISGSFYKKGTEDSEGGQIDLLIDRNDQVINLFEIKFYNEPFTMTKDYAERLRSRMGIFRESTKTRKQLFWVFISTFGLKDNAYSLGIVSKSLTLEDLFGE